MAKKTEPQRKIDVGAGSASSGGEVLSSTASVLIPSLPTPGPPENLTLISNTIGRSSATPVARVVVAWTPPAGVQGLSYLVEAGTDSTFATILVRGTAVETSAVLDLPASTAVAIRVYAQSTAAQSSPSAVLTLTTAADTTPAGVPTSAGGAFFGGGDLVVTWTNPGDENLRDVEVRIWNSSSKTTLYHTGYSANGRYIWTAVQNRQETSGSPDASVYVELRSRTWGQVLGTAVVVGTITKSAPSTPSGLAADFTGPDCIITWTTAADVVSYTLTIDSVARTVIGGRFVYAFDQNRVEHSGTADPVLTLGLVAVDGLSQSSSSAALTATNAAPSAPSSVTLVKGFSSFMATVSATEPADFSAYRWRIIQTSPAAADVTYDSAATLQTREAPANATYQVGVKLVDVFGLLSTETLSSALAVDALTLDDLRLDLSYRDSDSNTSGTLAALKDGVTASGGVVYAA